MPVVKSFLNAHPVGCVYTSAVSTSPATLFGGTWTALDSVFLVAKGAAGTFSTPGATGGAETITLTAAQSGLPAHDHPIAFKYNSSAFGSVAVALTSTGTDGSNSAPIADNTAAAASQAHSNLPPYKVVYMWERTA